MNVDNTLECQLGRACVFFLLLFRVNDKVLVRAEESQEKLVIKCPFKLYSKDNSGMHGLSNCT